MSFPYSQRTPQRPRRFASDGSPAQRLVIESEYDDPIPPGLLSQSSTPRRPRAQSYVSETDASPSRVIFNSNQQRRQPLPPSNSGGLRAFLESNPDLSRTEVEAMMAAVSPGSHHSQRPRRASSSGVSIGPDSYTTLANFW